MPCSKHSGSVFHIPTSFLLQLLLPALLSNQYSICAHALNLHQYVVKEVVNMSIIASHISYSIGHNTILSDISLNAQSGDFIALTGPSGCGKTTLL